MLHLFKKSLARCCLPPDNSGSQWDNPNDLSLQLPLVNSSAWTAFLFADDHQPKGNSHHGYHHVAPTWEMVKIGDSAKLVRWLGGVSLLSVKSEAQHNLFEWAQGLFRICFRTGRSFELEAQLDTLHCIHKTYETSLTITQHQNTHSWKTTAQLRNIFSKLRHIKACF